jgi:hypothetical protein
MTKKALRLNTNKPKLSYILLFPHVLQALARIMEFGGIKYEDGNWKLGGKPDQEYQDSGMRHLTKWINGEKFDEDSGCSHLGHAIWNFMALLELNHPDEIIDEKVFKEQCEYWTAKKAEKAEEEEVPSCLGCEFDQCRVDEPCRKESRPAYQPMAPGMEDSDSPDEEPVCGVCEKNHCECPPVGRDYGSVEITFRIGEPGEDLDSVAQRGED